MSEPNTQLFYLSPNVHLLYVNVQRKAQRLTGLYSEEKHVSCR